MISVTQEKPNAITATSILDKVESILDRLKFVPISIERKELINNYKFYAEQYNNIVGRKDYDVNFVPAVVVRPKVSSNNKPKIINNG